MLTSNLTPIILGAIGLIVAFVLYSLLKKHRQERVRFQKSLHKFILVQ